MTIVITVAYTLAGLIAAAIIVIGARFLIAPRAAAAGYGLQPDLTQPSVGAYMSIKGIRDIASGFIVIIVMAAGQPHVLGSVILAATIIPLADAVIVLRNGGPASIAWGIHGATAATMLVTAALLLAS
ncbi:DUF4267 domain-containing protein [Mycobacterium sp. ITM-2016-00316]|uniref:DUF4267 domain-containing protein n=1 Tax=Mycobacterium sp. ITM-2016-00316 TaxID=2099695 RepID=UPI000CF98AF3|nr:DUF4267 domain-containing protein [Mycobacterium sp. ITM-2016-00316]WNG83455.1 DUF4267 domain-containing protein [Mycobacterium sp. ITM-2016-00316]